MRCRAVNSSIYFTSISELDGVMKLTKRNRAYLRKHAKYLYALTDESKFDMSSYSTCALGYAAVVFPRIAKRNDSWWAFCIDVFGLTRFSEEWDFLFSAKWTGIDNTITGAADRIIYVLKHGVPEDNWNPEVYRSAS